MKCPRDQSILTFTDDGKRMRNRCPGCSGLLLGDHEVAQTIGNGQGGPRALDSARVAALPQGGLACPRDGVPMRLLVHQGVELDLCAECGSLWLDTGELEKIGARKGRKAMRAAAIGAAAGAVAVAAAAPQASSSLVGDIAAGVGATVADGVVEVALEFVGEAVGALLEGLF